MPRKDTSRIRPILLRLDLDDPTQAAIYAHYEALTADGKGQQWMRDTLAKALAGDSTAPQNIVEKIIATPWQVKGDSSVTVDSKVAPADVRGVIAPLPEKSVSAVQSPVNEGPAKPKAASTPFPLKRPDLVMPPGYGQKQKSSVFNKPAPDDAPLDPTSAAFYEPRFAEVDKS